MILTARPQIDYTDKDFDALRELKSGLGTAAVIVMDKDTDLVRAIAERAMARRSGARGLRAIIETVMLDVMYEVPSVEGISEVVITEAVVRGEGEPEYQQVQELGVTS